MEGKQRCFVFSCLTIGLNDAAWALTKLLRFPLQRWRKGGARAFIHLDDGIGAVKSERRAQEVASRVNADLAERGLGWAGFTPGSPRWRWRGWRTRRAGAPRLCGIWRW